jgi:hypothetical protein
MTKNKILIVDDGSMNTKKMIEMLEEMEDYEIDFFENEKINSKRMKFNLDEHRIKKEKFQREIKKKRNFKNKEIF